MDRLKALLVGDFVKFSGFARVNEAIAEQLAQRGWDVAVLAVQYHGDPTPLQKRYRLYPAGLGGDMLGRDRLPRLITAERPDVVLIVNDPAVVADYLAGLAALPEPHPPIVAYMPVDAPGLPAELLAPLNTLAQLVAYTRFGEAELRRAGYAGPSVIIPHGVDLDTFAPTPQAEARTLAGLPEDVFAVLVVDRNSPRKRLDIALRAFALFARNKPEARLVYHGAVRGDFGWNLDELAGRLGILDKFVVTGQFRPLGGVPVSKLATLYSLADVKLSTAMGEGWGLTTMEAMACGVPCVAADYAALGEWARGVAELVPVSDIHTYAGEVGTDGGVVSPHEVAATLDALYYDADLRAHMAQLGRALVERPEYRWETIGAQFDYALRLAVAGEVPA